MEICCLSLYGFCKFQRRVYNLNQCMILVNLKTHKMDMNVPKEKNICYH